MDGTVSHTVHACESPLASSLQRQVMRKCPVYRIGVFPMDAEHINQIGTTLTDLTARTHELRGYL